MALGARLGHQGPATACLVGVMKQAGMTAGRRQAGVHPPARAWPLPGVMTPGAMSRGQRAGTTGNAHPCQIHTLSGTADAHDEAGCGLMVGGSVQSAEGLLVRLLYVSSLQAGRVAADFCCCSPAPGTRLSRRLMLLLRAVRCLLFWNLFSCGPSGPIGLAGLYCLCSQINWLVSGPCPVACQSCIDESAFQGCPFVPFICCHVLVHAQLMSWHDHVQLQMCPCAGMTSQHRCHIIVCNLWHPNMTSPAPGSDELAAVRCTCNCSCNLHTGMYEALPKLVCVSG